MKAKTWRWNFTVGYSTLTDSSNQCTLTEL